jgi:hypothetical protein
MVLFTVYEEDGSDALYEINPIYIPILERIHNRRFIFISKFRKFTENPDGTRNYSPKDLIPGPFEYSIPQSFPDGILPEDIRTFLNKFRHGQYRNEWTDVATKINLDEQICTKSDYWCYFHH